MSGKILGVYRDDVEHVCKFPMKLFKKTYTVWLCDCDKYYRLEWHHIPFESYRYWEPYKISRESKK